MKNNIVKSILTLLLTLFAALFLCCHSATAQQQRDTIQGLDVRYYRNCFWLDSTQPAYYMRSAGTMDAASRYNQRMAFRFEPDRPLKIIGIAGAMTLNYNVETEMSTGYGTGIPMPQAMHDSVVAYRKKEYFELYGTRVYDSVGNLLQDVDSLTLLGSLQWSLTDSSRFMTLPISTLAYNPTSAQTWTVPIIERYFHKPIWQDSVFYIGFTNFNVGATLPQPDPRILSPYLLHTTVRIYSTYTNPTVPYEGVPDPCFSMLVDEHGDSVYNVLFQRPTSDTNLYEPWTSDPEDIFNDIYRKSPVLPLFFPIIDTTGMNIMPGVTDPSVCDTVRDFRLLDQQGSAAAFAWTSNNNQRSYQLSWGEEGIAPEDGTLVNVYNNVKTLSGLQDSVVYTAFIRAKCNDTLYSEWSAPIRFWKGMPLGIQPGNTVEQLTCLYPNPAENSVTVACSFAMSLVELFALDGTKLLSQPAQGVVTQLDLTTLPQGTYMLRITTPAGTAIKKLVKR